MTSVEHPDAAAVIRRLSIPLTGDDEREYDALLDLVGNDVSLEIIESLYGEFRDPFLAPAPMLKQMVAAGSFRSDLFFSVSVVNLRVPSLR